MNFHKITSKYTNVDDRKNNTGNTKDPINTSIPSANSQKIYLSFLEVDNTSKF